MKFNLSTLTLLFAFALISCDNSKSNKQAEDWNNFFGSWCNNEGWEQGGLYFNLNFKAQNDTLTEISFATGGPFEEILSGKLVSDTKAELYFNYLMGTHTPDDVINSADSKNDTKIKVAECTLQPDGTMKVETFSDEAGLIPEGKAIVLRKLGKNESCVPGISENEDGFGDPSSVTVAEYTPKQIRQILGKDKPQNVLDLFLLLPESDCFDLSIADRKKIISGETYSDENGLMLISRAEEDVLNNYLSLGGTFEGIWEMCSHEEDGIPLFAVNQQSCGPACVTERANLYSLEQGKILQHAETNLARFQSLSLDLFLDTDQLTNAQKTKAQKIWDESNNAVLFKLPRDGNTIKMYIEEMPYLDEGIPSEAFREVKTSMWYPSEEAM